MKSYFSQFGTVLRLRLSRNRKNGRSKHYGFVEFQHLEVAKIVAETLDNYLLSGRILSCKLLEKDQIHPKLWIGSEKKFKKDWKPRLARQTHNQVRYFFQILFSKYSSALFLLKAERPAHELRWVIDRDLPIDQLIHENG
ncbi:hypothetical protein BY996DRAFT_7263436 [Phakopsora pachyrhizi]|nr:hypothetical protein BY996DRAFT_7263436 [Phakopsora pachyrhizi]